MLREGEELFMNQETRAEEWLAFISLLIFGFAPLIVSIKTMRKQIFDIMVMDYQDLMDFRLFPLIKWAAVCVWILFLTRIGLKLRRRELRPGRFLREHPLILIAISLLGWMLISTLAVNGLSEAVRLGAGLKHEPFSLHILYYLGFLFLGLNLTSPRLKLWLFRTYLLVSMLLVPMAMYLYHHMTKTLQYIWEPSFEGPFSNPNYYGYFLTVMIGLACAMLAAEEKRGWRLFCAAALAVNSFGLSYNDTMGAWVGSLFACAFVVIARRLRDGRMKGRDFEGIVIFLAVMILTGLLNGNLVKNLSSLFFDLGLILENPFEEEALHAGSGRWRIWQNVIGLIAGHPLFGIGFEGIAARGLEEFVGNQRPHNEYLQYALFYGIPAAVLYIAFCLDFYIRGLKRRAQLDDVTLTALAAAFGYLVGAFFGLTVYNTAPYLFIMLGLGYAGKCISVRSDQMNAAH